MADILEFKPRKKQPRRPVPNQKQQSQPNLFEQYMNLLNDAGETTQKIIEQGGPKEPILILTQSQLDELSKLFKQATQSNNGGRIV